MLGDEYGGHSNGLASRNVYLFFAVMLLFVMLVAYTYLLPHCIPMTPYITGVKHTVLGAKSSHQKVESGPWDVFVKSKNYTDDIKNYASSGSTFSGS